MHADFSHVLFKPRNHPLQLGRVIIILKNGLAIPNIYAYRGETEGSVRLDVTPVRREIHNWENFDALIAQATKDVELCLA